MHVYTAWNAAAPTTAAMVKVTTGTTIKTMLQLSTPSTRQITVLAWGYELDAVPASTGGQIELIQTDVAATVTAHVAAGLQPADPNAPASLLTLGTANTGYTSTSEGSTTATRSFDGNFAAPSAGAQSLTYEMEFTAARRPVIAVSKFLRVRVTFAAAVNMLTWVQWLE